MCQSRNGPPSCGPAVAASPPFYFPGNISRLVQVRATNVYPYRCPLRCIFCARARRRACRDGSWAAFRTCVPERVPRRIIFACPSRCSKHNSARLFPPGARRVGASQGMLACERCRALFESWLRPRGGVTKPVLSPPPCIGASTHYAVLPRVHSPFRNLWICCARIPGCRRVLSFLRRISRSEGDRRSKWVRRWWRSCLFCLPGLHSTRTHALARRRAAYPPGSASGVRRPCYRSCNAHISPPVPRPTATQPKHRFLLNSPPTASI